MKKNSFWHSKNGTKKAERERERGREIALAKVECFQKTAEFLE